MEFKECNLSDALFCLSYLDCLWKWRRTKAALSCHWPTVPFHILGEGGCHLCPVPRHVCGQCLCDWGRMSQDPGACGGELRDVHLHCRQWCGGSHGIVSCPGRGHGVFQQQLPGIPLEEVNQAFICLFIRFSSSNSSFPCIWSATFILLLRKYCNTF